MLLLVAALLVTDCTLRSVVKHLFELDSFEARSSFLSLLSFGPNETNKLISKHKREKKEAQICLSDQTCALKLFKK